MKTYTVIHDTDDGWFPVASFAHKEDAEALVDLINPLLRDIDWDGLIIRENDVLEGALVLKDIEAITDLLDEEIMLDQAAEDMLLHLEAMRSAPEDYSPAMLLRWGVELPEQQIVWSKNEEPSMEMGL